MSKMTAAQGCDCRGQNLMGRAGFHTQRQGRVGCWVGLLRHLPLGESNQGSCRTTMLDGREGTWPPPPPFPHVRRDPISGHRTMVPKSLRVSKRHRRFRPCKPKGRPLPPPYLPNVAVWIR